jgi:hypothetical protein
MNLLSRSSPLLLLAALLIGLPLLGVALSGAPLAPYLRIPPMTTEPASHAPFSWPVFGALALLIAASSAPFVLRIARARSSIARVQRERAAFPRWGWAGVALLLIAWWLAWHRYPFFEAFQRHSFTPLWLGYVLTISALTAMRTGHCLLLDRPRFVLALLPLSAAFWWLFEYLNRFVRNWHYVGIDALDAWQYFWQATLPFATVLPAVLATRELLASFPALSAGLGDAWRIAPRRPRLLAAAVLAVASIGLALIGVLPQQSFALLWVSPLLLLVCIQAILRRPTVLAPIALGDWRALWQAALAGLVCGLCWELWNTGSLAQWHYSIAYVDRFHIFEMPLLGYAGYLPFGVLCVALGDAVTHPAGPHAEARRAG